VVPLLSLLKDQLRKYEGLQVPAGVIKGKQSREERDRIFKKIGERGIQIVFTTPEALLQPGIRKTFNRLEVSHFVVDEAHCVSEWGPRFRPAYLQLGEILKGLRGLQAVTAFTATATQPVIKKIKEILFSNIEVTVISGNPDRPNISYQVIPVLSKSRALEGLMEFSARPLLVFSRSRQGAESIARTLSRRLQDEEIFFYHAGLFPEERARIESWFMDSGKGILVSTSAYGMGVDKSNIRSVIHADIPPSVESYLQESGRIGRDGNPAKAILLYSIQDILFLNELKNKLERRRFAQMLSYALSQERCRRDMLLSYLGAGEISCSGCDVCDNRVAFSPEGEQEIVNLVSKHKRSYTRRQLQQILSGRKSYDVIKDHMNRVTGFGVLSHWDAEDIAEAISTMVESDQLLIPQKGLWKYCVTVRRHEAHGQRVQTITKKLGRKKG
ncbi:MAG: RecQ family ATP-dependent DNA helicase, partial [Spirochaeta sp.]|nr:RecQ family ATP-dependent DNA helicase [Spirochaeta sp.]